MGNRIVIRTTRQNLILREFISEDAAALFMLVDRDREHLSQWDEPTSKNYPDYKSVLRALRITENDVHRFGIWENEILVGSISLYLEFPKESADVGYWIGSEYANRGLMTLALIALARYAFETIRLQYLAARVRKQNEASRKVLLKAGFLDLYQDESMITLRKRKRLAAW